MHREPCGQVPYFAQLRHRTVLYREGVCTRPPFPEGADAAVGGVVYGAGLAGANKNYIGGSNRNENMCRKGKTRTRRSQGSDRRGGCWGGSETVAGLFDHGTERYENLLHVAECYALPTADRFMETNRGVLLKIEEGIHTNRWLHRL
jgi:hypothetical protein